MQNNTTTKNLINIMGRKAIDPKEKKILFRIFVKAGILEAITEEKKEELKNQFIKKLENETYN
jgi:hypothetical protein